LLFCYGDSINQGGAGIQHSYLPYSTTKLCKILLSSNPHLTYIRPLHTTLRASVERREALT
jgi:hypothetical protein